MQIGQGNSRQNIDKNVRHKTTPQQHQWTHPRKNVRQISCNQITGNRYHAKAPPTAERFHRQKPTPQNSPQTTTTTPLGTQYSQFIQNSLK